VKIEEREGSYERRLYPFQPSRSRIDRNPGQQPQEEEQDLCVNPQEQKLTHGEGRGQRS